MNRPVKVRSIDVLIVFGDGSTTTVHFTNNADEPPLGLEALYKTAATTAETIGAVIIGFVSRDEDGGIAMATNPNLDAEEAEQVQEELVKMACGDGNEGL